MWDSNLRHSLQLQLSGKQETSILSMKIIRKLGKCYVRSIKCQISLEVVDAAVLCDWIYYDQGLNELAQHI